MRVQQVTLHRYRLPLTAPLDLGPLTITHRDGALVRMEDAEGHVGWGDVAPLPGFSAESLAEACTQVRATALALTEEPLLDGTAEWALAVEALHARAERPAAPSARFGVEQALAVLIARRRGESLVEVFANAPRPTVALNALLMGAPDALRAEAERVQATGYRAAKLKVGRRALKEEARLVRALHEQWGDALAIRLDANRAWTWDEARTFADALGGVPIEYIEEPLADPANLPDLAAATGLPIALDESIQDGTVQALADHRYACAAVLKPMLTGGLRAAQQWAADAERLGMTPVLSASYESGIGMQALVALAATLSAGDVPVGLDTYRRLAGDVLAPRLSIGGATVRVRDVLNPRHTIRPDALLNAPSFPS